jgi:acetylornithine deacetylase/succinyl-diaminopimelate desuccinylase-like protein
MPPGDKPWQHPPFGGEMSFNQLWGRGTLDMKGLAICQLLAFADVAHGPTPEHDVVFLATADEETGSAYGMQWLIAQRPDVLEGVRYGITEGGVTEMMSEKMTYFGIEVGGKQFVALTLVGDDRERMEKARLSLERFMFPREPGRVLPAVRRYLRGIAPTRLTYKPYLADIDRTIAEGQFWRLPAPYRDLTQNTLTVTAPIRSGNGWRMDVVQLNLPDEVPAERIAWLERQVAPYGIRIGEVTQQQGPVPISDENTALFALLRDEARRRYDVVAGMQINYRSTSDARFLRTRGILCYGVSPYPVDFYQSKTIHNRDERIRLDAFMEGIAYLRSVVSSWAGRAATH